MVGVVELAILPNVIFLKMTTIQYIHQVTWVYC